MSGLGQKLFSAEGLSIPIGADVSLPPPPGVPPPPGALPPSVQVFLAGLVQNPRDPAELVTIEVEVVPVGTAFTGVPTPDGGSQWIADGSNSTITVGFSVEGEVHWQARAMTQGGTPGPWVSFGGNPKTDPDFRLVPFFGIPPP